MLSMIYVVIKIHCQFANACCHAHITFQTNPSVRISSVKLENSLANRMVNAFQRNGNVTERKIALMELMKRIVNTLKFIAMQESSSAKLDAYGKC